MTIDSTTHQKSRWLPSIVQQRGKFILAIPVTCLVTSLCAFGWLEFNEARSGERLQQTQQVSLEAQRLLTALLDAETEVRGYAITRRPEFLNKYQSALADIPDSLDQLRRLVANNPSQSQRIREIRELATARVRFLQSNLQLINSLPKATSVPMELEVRLLEGKPTRDRTRDQIEQFLVEEKQIQAESDRRLRQQQQLMWVVLLVSAGLGIAGSVLAAYLWKRLTAQLSEHDRHLQESEARYRAVVENFPNGTVLLFNSELRYLLADGSSLATVGLTKQQLEGKTIWESLSAETCSVLEPLYRNAIAGEATTAEIPYADRIFLAHIQPLRNEASEIFAGMVVTQDITERKLSEQQLSKANRALKTLSQCNQTLVHATDEPTFLQDICQNIVEFGGYRSAWIGFAQHDEAKTVRPVAQAGYQQGYLESIQITWSDTEWGRSPAGTAIRTGQPSIAQNILTDPSYLPWREAALQRGYAASISLPLIINAKPVGSLNIYAIEPNAFDETEVQLLTELANDLAYGINALRTQVEGQQAQVALRESKQRLDSILNSIEDVVWSVSATTYDVLYLSPAAEKVYQRPIQAFFDNPNFWIEVVHPEDDQRVSTFHQSLLELGNLTMEYRILRPDGEVRWLYDRGSVTYDQQGRAIRLDGISTDITARKQAEEALRESEERWQLALRGNNDGIWDWNVRTNEVFLSARWKEMLGFEDHEIANHLDAWSKRVHPDDLAWVMQAIQDHFDGKTPFYTSEHRIQCKDGSYKWILDRGQALWDENGTVVRMTGSHTDITDRKQSEEVLRDTNQRIQALIQASPLAILSLEPDGRVKTWNEAAQKMFGWSATEVIGKPLPTVPSDRQEEFRRLLQRTSQGETITGVEVLRQKRDGTPVHISLSKAPLYDARGQIDGIIAVIADISDRKQAEESLRESETKFRAFVEAASEAIVVTNPKGKIVIFNAKAEQLFGYDRTEVLGKTVEFLMPERFHQGHVAHRATYREQPTKRSMGKTQNLFAQRKDGTEFPIEAGLSPVQTKDGTFVLTFLTDITERKQAEDEIQRLNENLKRRAVELETRYQQIVELAEEGIWVVDAQAKTTYVNHAMARMLGYTEEEMLGRPMLDFMDWLDRQIANSKIGGRKQGIAEKHEFKLRAKDGKIIWTYMSTSHVLDESGKMLWSCALVYDITERKQAEEQLRESTERISLANAELARATRLKDEFLASMSHELRTPLNAILGLSEALQEEVYGSLTDKQRRSLSTIEQSGRHLLELITEILDLSKIESGKMELQFTAVSLYSLCESSLTFVKQQAHQKSINLNFKIGDGLEEAELDERRIRQLLVNLLSNAVKFTPEGGEIWLSVEADLDSEILQFKVIDTGIGIAPENIDKLFKAFVQLDSSLSRRYAGTGLGLALVRRIAELHGGSITLESEVGHGSCFTVTLPWKQPDQNLVSEQEQTESELPSLQQALIVEDSDAAAKHIARYLGELGCAAHIHPQGEGALEAVLRVAPEVIVLDLLLPNLSGWEVLAQLKADPRTQNIPVLVISVMDERSRAKELGASEYLLKPITRQQLQSALRKVLSTAPQQPRNTALVVMSQTQRNSPLVLLAEDNEANISTMMDYLQIQGYQVSVARNGVEAVQQAKQHKPDLILMDIQMPEMDGLEATYRIRCEADVAAIPIIAITALAMPGDRERCLAAGAVDYLTKPVSLKQLVNIIEQHLKPN